MKHPYNSDVKNWLCSIYTKLKFYPSNPAYDCTFNPKYKQQFEQKAKTIKPFGLRMEPILQESAISVTNVHKSILPQIPLWIIKKPQVILQLNKLPRTKTHPNTYLEKFHTILTINIDLQMAPRIAIKQPVLLFSIRPFRRKPFLWKSSLQKYVPLTLLWTSFLRTNNKFIIFSDSLSVLT